MKRRVFAAPRIVLFQEGKAEIHDYLVILKRLIHLDGAQVSQDFDGTLGRRSLVVRGQLPQEPAGARDAFPAIARVFEQIGEIISVTAAANQVVRKAQSALRLKIGDFSDRLNARLAQT